MMTGSPGKPSCGHSDCFTCPYPDCSPRHWRKKQVPSDAVERMEAQDKAHLRVVDYDRMTALYELGWPDGKIAKELGLVDQGLVCKWRKRYNLPAHGNKKRTPKFDPIKAGEMYWAGANDKVIADAMGIDRSQVYQWRKKEGLGAVNKMQDKLKEAITEQEAHQPVVAGLEHDMDAVPNETIVTAKELQIPVIEASLTDFESIIEEKNAIINELLTKNSELAGFIDGMKFLANTIARFAK